MICSVEGCVDTRVALGLCSKHYQRYKKYGDTVDRPRVGRLKGSGLVPLAERFWKHVDKSDPDNCWLWTGGTSGGGYGVIGRGGRGAPQIGAHVASYEIHYGPIQGRLWVLHRCDNPPCVNPNHLFLGTGQDNRDDCRAKGRNRTGVSPGSKNGSAKMTDEQIRVIRQRWAAGEKQIDLAHEFGVHWSTMHNIVREKSWKVSI